jgi:SAM-dependent methyltransferase
VDVSPSAVELARAAAGDLACRFEVAEVPPVPAGAYDVVLLLETMLAFPDKGSLLEGISAALRPGGRFAFTLEEGLPLTAAERAVMPDADTVWLSPLPELVAALSRVGLVVRWQRDRSRSHRVVADRLVDSFAADRTAIARHVGEQALDDLLCAHRLWSGWLRSGRVRKLALVAEKVES